MKNDTAASLAPIVIFLIMYELVGRAVVYTEWFTQMSAALFWSAVVIALFMTVGFYGVLFKLRDYIKGRA